MAGIACAGHWVLDSIKFVDHWPQQAELCNIVEQEICNGGAPFNLIVDLANLKVPFPTYGIGCIGDDAAGQQILAMCKDKNINIDYLQTLAGEATSYTDVMTLTSNAVRTMFHYHGANKKFSAEHVPLQALKEKDVKLFYLGHLLVMDALEQQDQEYGNVCARLLHDVQQAGIETAVDIATESSNRYQKVVIPTLPYIDHFIINELEAGKTSGYDVRGHKNQLIYDGVKKAARFLMAEGVKKNVVIHMPEGAHWLNHQGEEMFYPSLNIPKEHFKATCGAGDAFCSGILTGLHEGWSQKDCLRLATATAASSITSSHNSNGIKPIEETLELSTLWAAHTSHDAEVGAR
jgi:sugar/nucleoside kinase (ribokinase family)